MLVPNVGQMNITHHHHFKGRQQEGSERSGRGRSDVDVDSEAGGRLTYTVIIRLCRAPGQGGGCAKGGVSQGLGPVYVLSGAGFECCYPAKNAAVRARVPRTRWRADRLPLYKSSARQRNVSATPPRPLVAYRTRAALDLQQAVERGGVPV